MVKTSRNRQRRKDWLQSSCFSRPHPVNTRWSNCQKTLRLFWIMHYLIDLWHRQNELLLQIGVNNHSTFFNWLLYNFTSLKRIYTSCMSPPRCQRISFAPEKRYSDLPLRQDLRYYFVVIFRLICITQPRNNRIASVTNFPTNICTGSSLI